MKLWPLICILAEQFDALPEADKQLLEAITAAFLVEVERQRLADARPPPKGLNYPGPFRYDGLVSCKNRPKGTLSDTCSAEATTPPTAAAGVKKRSYIGTSKRESLSSMRPICNNNFLAKDQLGLLQLGEP